MLDEKWMDVVCALAEKMSRGEKLNVNEQELYEDIQEDAESYRVFSLYTALTDMPALYMDGGRENVEWLFRDKEGIDRCMTERLRTKDLQMNR